jgi:hypothetical protein
VDIRLERGAEKQATFRLMIDGMSLTQWFKQKYREFQEAIGMKPKQTHKNWAKAKELEGKHG